MGLLDDYNVDIDSVDEAAGFKGQPEPGFYAFEVGNVHIQEGSKNNPDQSWLIITYLLEGDDDEAEAEEYGELFALPADPDNPTPKEIEKLGWYKRRLRELGIAPEQMGSVDRDDLIGIRGTFKLVGTAGKGANKDRIYLNIRDMKVGEVSDDPTDYDDDSVEAKVAAKKSDLPAELVAALDAEPIVLPAWDPMGALAVEF